jgi:hypothetical protein
MHMYVCMCIHIYIYMCVCVCIYIYIYIYIQVYIYTYASNQCVPTYVTKRMHANERMHACVYAHASSHGNKTNAGLRMPYNNPHIIRADRAARMCLFLLRKDVDTSCNIFTGCLGARHLVAPLLQPGKARRTHAPRSTRCTSGFYTLKWCPATQRPRV